MLNKWIKEWLSNAGSGQMDTYFFFTHLVSFDLRKWREFVRSCDQIKGKCVLKCNYLYIVLLNGNSLQCSCLEKPRDRGAWRAAVHGVEKSRPWLSDFTFTFHFHALGKEMATHSSVLAWRIPGTEEPGGLLSMGSHRVRHDWSDLAAVLLKLKSDGN